jgi:hypothetical protein
MNFPVVAAVVSGLLAAGWQTSPTQFSPDSNLEHVEQGRLPSAGGGVSYRIRLLPLTSFPEMPSPVMIQLSRRGCMVPQSFEAQAPENVIHGSFQTPGSSDWAALCSVGGSTTLYVFLGGQLETPIALRSQPDTAWLGAEPGSSVFGSGWGISVRSAGDLRASHQLHGAAAFDHDGIEDAHLEHSTTVRYREGSQWLALGNASP